MNRSISTILLSACAFMALPLALATGCADGTNSANTGGAPIVGSQDNTLRVAAGMRELTPVESSTALDSVNLAGLGITHIDAIYEVSTPADTEFSFTLATRREGNAGEATISIAHAAIDGITPSVGVESLVDAGMNVNAAGQTYRDRWLDVTGDGFARVTIGGEIGASQILIGSVHRPDGSTENVAVVITIGNESEINLPDNGAIPGVTKSDRTIYSSDSWTFGLPAIAVSGDRYSVAAYDASNADDMYDYSRIRRWLQYDETNATVTGGSSNNVTPDSGFWRDQEIASAANILAVAYTTNTDVRCDVSLDRGASFPINQVLETSQYSWGASRLVQVAIAPDYTLGVLYWRSVGQLGNGRSELVLVEGTPTGFNEFNTPDGYDWSEPRIVHAPGVDVTPLVMEIEYDADGRAVVGYGYTRSDLVEGTPFRRNTASFRCAVQNPDESFRDVEVDMEENIMPCDPSISLVGTGETMQVFYTYEKTDGIHVARSLDAGLTFAAIATAGSPGAMAPSIHVRDQAGEQRVDVLYLEPTAYGFELHGLHWDDYATAPSATETRQYTTAAKIDIPGGGMETPGAPNFAPWSPYMIRSIPWFGYDAVDSGDDIAVVVHTQVQYAYSMMGWGFPGMPILFDAVGAPQAGSAAGAPPILLPGMSDPVNAPNDDHANQLKIIVID